MRGVILTTVGRKNLLQSIEALTAHVILKGFALKNLKQKAHGIPHTRSTDLGSE